MRWENTTRKATTSSVAQTESGTTGLMKSRSAWQRLMPALILSVLIGLVSITATETRSFAQSVPPTLVHDVTIGWTMTTQGDVARYDIRWGTDSNNLPIVGTAPADAREFTVLNQADGMTYYASVEAVDNLGFQSGESDQLEVPLAHQMPEMPTLVVIKNIVTRPATPPVTP